MPTEKGPKIKYPEEGRTRTEKKEEEAVKEGEGEKILKEDVEKEEKEIEAKDEKELAEERAKIEEELTPEQRRIIEKQEKEKEEGMKKIWEMENWRELQRKGLLTEKAKGILNKLEGVISEIEHKAKILTDVKDEAKTFKARIERGEISYKSIPEEKWQNPLIDLEEREKEMKKLEENYNQLKEELRELERREELVGETESEKEEGKISEEEAEISEGEEKKNKGKPGIITGIKKRLFGKK
ncbi:hypothetical protein KAU51_00075 [Candidatus Parcubacteria bacterium]|nr:hypothetical protein [Candidatus Parcubacteria bacterium]